MAAAAAAATAATAATATAAAAAATAAATFNGMSAQWLCHSIGVIWSARPACFAHVLTLLRGRASLLGLKLRSEPLLLRAIQNEIRLVGLVPSIATIVTEVCEEPCARISATSRNQSL